MCIRDRLYAAGDVAGGCPQKYVTGALVEGELAALDIICLLYTSYIVKERKPQDYVDYARKDADEIVRGDLLLTIDVYKRQDQ